MANKTESIRFDYGDFCKVVAIGLTAMWFVTGMASLMVDLGGWQIWGRVALTQMLLFGAGSLIFAGVAAWRAARKRGRWGSGDAFFAAGIIVAIALCALAANVWAGYAIYDQRIIKVALAVICAGACGVYWLGVGMFTLIGGGARAALWGARAVAVATCGVMLLAIVDGREIAWDRVGGGVFGFGVGYAIAGVVYFIMFLTGFEADAKRKGGSLKVSSILYGVLALGVLFSWILILYMAMPAGALRLGIGMGVVVIAATFYLGMVAEWCKMEQEERQCGRRW